MRPSALGYKDQMDIDSAPLNSIEDFLRRHEGHWATLPDSLAASIRDNRAGDEGFGEAAQALIAEARIRSYDQTIRSFAKALQQSTRT